MAARSLFILLPLAALLGACVHQPPPDYAADPALVEKIRELRIQAPPEACPGSRVEPSYAALLADGRRLAFSTTYDPDEPPPLHVVLLALSSRQGEAYRNGAWDLESDPRASAMEGFRLHAAFKAKPSLETETVIAPEYSCLPNEFKFQGSSSSLADRPGQDGPDVTVRLAVLSSPFYERLLVARIEVPGVSTRTLLADADHVPPADWLVIESIGGAGYDGMNGLDGPNGMPGAQGCPGAPGGPGYDGLDGFPASNGGNGGHFTIVVPEDDPFLAGLVDARSIGGAGGAGGRGGKGGAGGPGGPGAIGVHTSSRVSGGASISIPYQCKRGPDGPPGRPGHDGINGIPGDPGPRPTIVTAPLEQVFGSNPPLPR